MSIADCKAEMHACTRQSMKLSVQT